MESRAIPSTLPRANAGQHASKLARSGKKGCRERRVKGRRRASSTSKKRRPPYSKAYLEEPGYGYEPLLFLTRRGEERDEKYLPRSTVTPRCMVEPLLIDAPGRYEVAGECGNNVARTANRVLN